MPWLAALAGLALTGSATGTEDPAAYDLHQRTRGQTDLERLRAGRVGAQFWSV